MELHDLSIDLNNIPIKVLKSKTRGKLCCMLNGTKVLPSPSGLPRDWRGLADLAGITVSCDFSGVNAVDKILTFWGKNNDATVGKLQHFLKKIDRYDVYDDTKEMILDDVKLSYDLQENCSPGPKINTLDESNILTSDDLYRYRNNLPPQTYDAFVLFVDDDIDFAQELIYNMEENYGLKLCIRDRDLIGGACFEHEAIMRLISERCNRLVVILSPDFLRSNAHQFFVNFAQAIAIEQRKRKVIPCKYKPCLIQCEVLRSYYILDYTRANRMWNFWDKMRDSIIDVSSGINNPNKLLAIQQRTDDKPAIKDVDRSTNETLPREDKLEEKDRHFKGKNEPVKKSRNRDNSFTSTFYRFTSYIKLRKKNKTSKLPST